MTLALKDMGTQARGGNCFCGLPGHAGLHSLLEHSSLEVLSCTRNIVPVTKKEISFPSSVFLQTQRDPQTGGGVRDCLLSLHHSPAPCLGLSRDLPAPLPFPHLVAGEGWMAQGWFSHVSSIEITP